MTLEEVRSILYKMYGTSLTEEVVLDVIDSDKILNYYDFPNCFNCEKCPVEITCSLKYVLMIQKKMQLISKKNAIKQIDISKIINHNGS